MRYLFLASLLTLIGCSNDAAPDNSVGSPLVLRAIPIGLPDDEPMFAGPGGDSLNSNCLACHSSAMIRTQPPLSADQWKAVVLKMRDVYKAPLADDDINGIVRGLVSQNAKSQGSHPSRN